MRRTLLNLFALFAIGLGGSYLGGVDTAGAYPGCVGPARERMCLCTSLDGRWTCWADSCVSEADRCIGFDIPPEASGPEDLPLEEEGPLVV